MLNHVRAAAGGGNLEEVVDGALEAADLGAEEGARRRAEELRVDGNADFEAKRFVEALEAYDEALRLRPTSLVYRLNRAAALYELGRHAEVRGVVTTS
jgi:tetratricopeptide (TPR) repeat protein